VEGGRQLTQAKKLAILILLGVAMLVLAIIVYVADHRTGDHLLATIGILGGLAVVVVTLPTNGGDNGKHGSNDRTT
jgi:peptidoglycan/LPS O-acetylase OafA/YrhL